ncbi:MAG TPA: HAMP domain-containing sensor histidine kinase [Planktothrix sp.]
MRGVKLSLSQKGMIVIAIPVLLQLLFVMQLSKMLEEAEATARLQYTSKEVFNYSDWLGVLVLASELSGIEYKVTGDRAGEQDFQSYKGAIPQELKLMRTLVGETPGERQRFQKIEELTGAFMGRLESATTSGGEPSAEQRLRKFDLQQTWRDWRRLDGERRDLINEYKRNHILQAEELPSAQEKLSHFVLLGVLLTFFGAFVLFLGFSKGVTQRLAVMTENAVRLTRKQALNAPVGGRDEIAHLDQAFHQAADALVTAEQQKQEFVDMIGHDLRTPLAALQGLLALVSSGVYGELSPDGTERVTRAGQDLLRLIRLINELLDVEKLSAGALHLQYRAVKISAVLSQSIDSVRALTDSRALDVIVSPTEEEVHADGDRLVQVIVNFLSNAIKYSPPESPIEITTERNGQDLRVSVKDRGCGIAEGDREMIFERFRQVRRSAEERQEGVGLGLAICKAIADAHGGRVGVDERTGGGSVFWIEIPRAPHITA